MLFKMSLSWAVIFKNVYIWRTVAIRCIDNRRKPHSQYSYFWILWISEMNQSSTVMSSKPSNIVRHIIWGSLPALTIQNFYEGKANENIRKFIDLEETPEKQKCNIIVKIKSQSNTFQNVEIIRCKGRQRSARDCRCRRYYQTLLNISCFWNKELAEH